MNVVLETDRFAKKYGKCEKVEQEWIDSIRDQLVQNLRIGKPLHFDWFREKRFGGKRLYFLASETKRKAVLIAFGTKKEQQQYIRHVVDNRHEYWRILQYGISERV